MATPGRLLWSIIHRCQHGGGGGRVEFFVCSLALLASLDGRPTVSPIDSIYRRVHAYSC
jgi:hypothetical protein